MTETMAQARKRHRRELEDLIVSAVLECNGNRSHAALMIGIDRGLMLRYIREWGIRSRLPKANRAVEFPHE